MPCLCNVGERRGRACPREARGHPTLHACTHDRCTTAAQPIMVQGGAPNVPDYLDLLTVSVHQKLPMGFTGTQTTKAAAGKAYAVQRQVVGSWQCCEQYTQAATRLSCVMCTTTWAFLF